MNENVNEWKIRSGKTVLGQVQTFIRNLDQTKINVKSLDGTYYIQTIGNPAKYATITVLANREETQLFNEADARGGLIDVTYRGIIYSGYLETAPLWQPIQAGFWYNASIKLLIVKEADAK